MASKSLKVLMPAAGSQRWSCHSCGRCCYDLVGHISREERQRIDRQGWGHSLGAEPYVPLGKGYVLNKRASGACVFLDESSNRCRIHEKFGEQAKPRACRIYPFTVRDVPDGWQVSWRFDCPSLAANLGDPVVDYAPLVRELTRDLKHQGATGDDCPELQPGLRATEMETSLVIDKLCTWLTDRTRPLNVRMESAAAATQLIGEAKFEAVRNERLGELVDLLLGVRQDANDAAAAAAPPTAKQRSMLRELAYVHAAHVSIEESRAGIGTRLRGRLAQLSAARRFRVGAGNVPDVRGLFDPRSNGRSTHADDPTATTAPPGGASDRLPCFDDVEAVSPASDPADVERIDDLMTRYLCHRLVTRSAFGYGYYRWPMFAGLAALWAGAAVVGWLARTHAAWQGRTELTFDDVFEGLRITDRSAGRSPALGIRAERLRLRVMQADDGLAKLLHRYALVEELSGGS